MLKSTTCYNVITQCLHSTGEVRGSSKHNNNQKGTSLGKSKIVPLSKRKPATNGIMRHEWHGNQRFFFLTFFLETSIFMRKAPEKFKIKQLFELFDGRIVSQQWNYASTDFEYIRWKRIPARTPKARLPNSTFVLWGFIVWLSNVCFHFSSIRSTVEFVGKEAYFKQKLDEEKTAFPDCPRKEIEGLPLCYCGIWIKMEYCSREDSFQGIS